MMDNAIFQQSKQMRELIEETGAVLLYILP